MDPLFLATIFGIMWLSSSLLVRDVEEMRAAERRLERCPAHVR